MMRARRKFLSFLTLLVLLVALVYNRFAPDGDSTQAEIQTMMETDPVSEVADNLPPNQQDANSLFSGARSSGDPVAQAEVAKIIPAYTLDTEVSIGEWLENFRESVRAASPEDYELKRQQAEELDAESAFWLYEFYRQCENAPRSEWQLEKILSNAQERVEAAAGRMRERKLDRVEYTLDWVEQSFLLCSFLGPDFDTRSESLAWLETAADLGHMAAQRLYHSQARELIAGNDSNLAFQRPDLIHAFRLNATRYARNLMETDHPQGFMLMARMYYVGDVFKQDYALAYAYAQAAYFIGTAGAQLDAQNWMNLISAKLPPSEVIDAEQVARELLPKS